MGLGARVFEGLTMDLTGQAVDNLLLSRVDAPVGTYRDSHLPEAAFNERTLGVWMLCDGRGCVGTEFETDTGEVTVPDFVTEGAFRRQAKDGRTIGTYEADQMQGHKHDVGRGNWIGTYGSAVSTFSTGNGLSGYYGVGSPTSDGTNGTPRTGDETRSKNIACNVYIKVAHN